MKKMKNIIKKYLAFYSSIYPYEGLLKNVDSGFICSENPDVLQQVKG